MRTIALFSFNVRTVTVAAMALISSSALALQTGPVSVEPPIQPINLSLGQMFTYFFLMLGPLRILGPFMQLTQKCDQFFARRLAVRGFLFSCLTLLVAGTLGEISLVRLRIPIPVLKVAGGIILFLVALRALTEQFYSDTKKAPKEFEPDLRNALSPLAFPTIVTPYGIATVIVFLALSREYSFKVEIFGALFCLMLLNLVFMLFAKPILHYLGMPMQLAGAVLGVIQVALGLGIIFRGLRELGFGTLTI